MMKSRIVENERQGLWYLKGGDFLEELQVANIKKYSMTAVKDLVDIGSDKNVLYIPRHEIIAFDDRKKRR
jgi:hypothetical protein